MGTSPTLPLVVILLVAAAACGDERVDASAGPSTGSPASVGPGPVGSGGAGGGGGGTTSSGGGGPGSGGAAEGGGGSTSTATTTSSTGGIPDECGEPGDCAGDQPTACGSNACNAPEIDFICEGTDDEPDAFKACLLAEKAYRTGVWARFIDCLRDADADALCNDGETVVTDCLASTLAQTCPNPTADSFCDGLAATCAAEAQPFDVDACKEDLVPFGERGFELYGTCLDDPGVAGRCNRPHAECFDELTPP